MAESRAMPATCADWKTAREALDKPERSNRRLEPNRAVFGRPPSGAVKGSGDRGQVKTQRISARDLHAAELAVLAIAQMGIHLVFFLHMTSGPESTNNVLALAFGVLIVFVVVAGTMWIMADMNANMMMPSGAPMSMRMRH